MCMWEWRGREREAEKGGGREEEIIWADVVCWSVVYKDENGIDHLTQPSLTLCYQGDRRNGGGEERRERNRHGKEMGKSLKGQL